MTPTLSTVDASGENLQNCVWVTSGLPLDERNYCFFDLGPKVTFDLIINILLRVTPGLYRLTEI